MMSADQNRRAGRPPPRRTKPRQTRREIRGEPQGGPLPLVASGPRARTHTVVKASLVAARLDSRGFDSPCQSATGAARGVGVRRPAGRPGIDRSISGGGPARGAVSPRARLCACDHPRPPRRPAAVEPGSCHVTARARQQCRPRGPSVGARACRSRRTGKIPRPPSRPRDGRAVFVTLRRRGRRHAPFAPPVDPVKAARRLSV